MSADRLIKAFLNPLQFLEVDEPWPPVLKTPPDSETVLKFLCSPGIESDIFHLVKRYKEISNEPQRLNVVPAEDRILQKLIWPLRSSKASYMVGNYLGTISLCGMVAEMVAILLFEISEFQINGKAMTQEDEKSLFGSSFQKLGQERRVAILRAYNIIDDDIRADFDLIRTNRRRYLHLWSQDHVTLPGDAVAVYNSTIKVVIRAIGQNFSEGKVVLNPPLVKYLEKTGVYEPEKE